MEARPAPRRLLLSPLRRIIQYYGTWTVSNGHHVRHGRKDYASQVQLRALRKGPLTSKLARASLRRFTGPA
eukprot:1157006-Pelagomonas_calceolata.AAC.2